MSRAPDVRPVLRAGDLAYWDSLTAGPVPCKVLAITGKSGAPGSEQTVQFKLTAERGPWERGKMLWDNGARVVPRASLHSRRYGARITYYTVETTAAKGAQS